MTWRGVKRTLWAAGVLLALTGVAAGLAYYSPLPDQVAERMLNRLLDRSGGTLSVRERQGSLSRGFDWYGVTLDIPGRVTIKAEHLRLRLRAAPLLAGVVSIAELKLDGPEVTVAPPPPTGTSRRPVSRPLLGLPPISVSGATISGGRLTLPFALGSGAPGGTLLSDVEASLRGTAKGERITLSDLRLSFKAPAPIPGTVEVQGDLSWESVGRGRFDLSVATPRSRLRGRGAFSGRPTDDLCTTSLELQPVSLREAAWAWVGAPDLLVAGKGDVTLTRGSVKWSLTLDDPSMGPLATTGEVAFAGGPVRLTADVTTPGASLASFVKMPPGKGVRVSGRGSIRLTYDRSSGVAWKAEARLGPSSIGALEVASGEARASASGARMEVEGLANSPAAGPVRLAFRRNGASGDWRVEGSGESVDPKATLAGLGYALPLPSSLRLPEGRWGVPAFSLDRTRGLFLLAGSVVGPGCGTATFEGGPFAGRGPLSWSVRLRALNPQAWGSPRPGLVDADVSFAGESLTCGALQCRLLAAESAGIRLEPALISADISPSGFCVAPVTLRSSAGTFSGRLSLAGGRWEGDASFERVELGRMGWLVDQPTLRGQLTGKVTQTPSERLSLKGEVTASDLSWNDLGAQVVRLSGAWTGAAQEMDLRAEWTGLRQKGTALGDGAASLAGRPEAFGFKAHLSYRGEASLEASGRGALLTGGAGRLDLAALSLVLPRRTLVQEGPALLEWSPRHVAWSGVDMEDRNSRLNASGRVDFGEGLPSPRLSGRLTAAHMGFAVKGPPNNDFVVRGVLDADLSWAGTFAEPALTGQLGLSEGYYRWPDSDLAIAPVTATLTARGDRLEVTEARALCGPGGEATLAGWLAFKGFLPGDVNLKVAGRSFPLVVGRDMEATADFQVALTGTLAAPRVEGEVKVLKGRIQLPELGRQQSLPPTIRFVNAPENSPFRPDEEGPSALGPFRGSVAVSSSGGLWISNRSLMAELAGSVEARLTPEGTELEGSLTVLVGRYIFQNRKFELQESKVSFGGTTDLDPLLDVNAIYRAPDADVLVHVTGTARRPEVAFSSVPPMQQQDILATLLFGRPYKDLTGGEKDSWSSAVTVMAAQYKASGMMSAVQDTLGLETLTVGASANGVTEVGFSKYLNDRTVLEYRQVFGNLPETHVNLRYRINNQWSIQTEASTTNKAGVDVLWEHRY